MTWQLYTLYISCLDTLSLVLKIISNEIVHSIVIIPEDIPLTVGRPVYVLIYKCDMLGWYEASVNLIVFGFPIPIKARPYDLPYSRKHTTGNLNWNFKDGFLISKVIVSINHHPHLSLICKHCTSVCVKFKKNVYIGQQMFSVTGKSKWSTLLIKCSL